MIEELESKVPSLIRVLSPFLNVYEIIIIIGESVTGIEDQECLEDEITQILRII